MINEKAIGREVKTVTVSGKEFKISFVSTYTHVKVKELSDKIEQAGKIAGEFGKIKPDDPEKDKKLDELTAKMKTLNDSDVIKERLDLVKHVLEECNNTKYDERFWLRNTRIIDINNFLYDCLYKDWDKKKRKPEKKQK